jgi:DNA-directed RNA polymerase subunit RPC12/RpoP
MKCPGQDMQYWNTDAIYEVECPECRKPVEFYKDDTNRRCNHCGHRFVNPKMDFGCAAYCQYAEQCLGTLPEEFVGAQEGLLKDKVAVEMKRFFKSDFKQIGRATRVARYAEAIGKSEGVNLAPLLCAAYLQTTTSTDTDSGAVSTTVARDILTRLQAKEPMIEAVMALLGENDPAGLGLAVEEQILAEAQTLARLDALCKEDQQVERGVAETLSATLTFKESRAQATRLLANWPI